MASRCRSRPPRRPRTPGPWPSRPRSSPAGSARHKWVRPPPARRARAATRRRAAARRPRRRRARGGPPNVWIAEADVLVTPPLDGRILPGTVRAALIAAPAGPYRGARGGGIGCERLRAADELLLSRRSAALYPATLRGAHAVLLARRAGAGRRNTSCGSGHRRAAEPRAVHRQPSGLDVDPVSATPAQTNGTQRPRRAARARRAAGIRPAAEVDLDERSRRCRSRLGEHHPSEHRPRESPVRPRGQSGAEPATSLAVSAIASGERLASSSAASRRPAAPDRRAAAAEPRGPARRS